MEQTLVLNADYLPLSVITWQKAITLWYREKVEIIEVHDKEVWAVKFSFKLPSVVRLLRYVRTGKRPVVQFTRANIYTRDNYTCQYCQKEFDTSDLTFDHVIPVAQGGGRSWENIVSACIPCNRKKGSRTPEEAGMHLMRKPVRPNYTAMFRVTMGIRKTPESWKDFLYWNVKLDETE